MVLQKRQYRLGIFLSFCYILYVYFMYQNFQKIRSISSIKWEHAENINKKNRKIFTRSLYFFCQGKFCWALKSNGQRTTMAKSLFQKFIKQDQIWVTWKRISNLSTTEKNWQKFYRLLWKWKKLHFYLNHHIPLVRLCNPDSRLLTVSSYFPRGSFMMFDPQYELNTAPLLNLSFRKYTIFEY